LIIVSGQVVLSLSLCLEMGPRPRCPICLSRRWRKDPASGLVVCSEGHVFEVRPCWYIEAGYVIHKAQNYRNETIERDEPPSHALRKRTIKARKMDDQGPSTVNSSRRFIPFRPARGGLLKTVLQTTTENEPTSIILPACKSCFASKWQPLLNYGHSLQSLRPFLEMYGLWL
jgi:hypothetical protein